MPGIIFDIIFTWGVKIKEAQKLICMLWKISTDKWLYKSFCARVASRNHRGEMEMTKVMEMFPSSQLDFLACPSLKTITTIEWWLKNIRNSWTRRTPQGTTSALTSVPAKQFYTSIFTYWSCSTILGHRGKFQVVQFLCGKYVAACQGKVRLSLVQGDIANLALGRASCRTAIVSNITAAWMECNFLTRLLLFQLGSPLE